jgi:acyl-CoA thioester hydrolase
LVSLPCCHAPEGLRFTFKPTIHHSPFTIVYMQRVKLTLPENFEFSTDIPVRITDINYGNHLGNDAVLSIIHEARVRYLATFGYGELKIESVGLIMSDAAIEFKNEAFYGDVITVYVKIADVSKVSFNIFYRLVKKEKGSEVLVANAKTAMVAFNYDKRKVMALPEGVVKKFPG